MTARPVISPRLARRLSLAAAAFAGLGCGAPPAWAHHSFAMFDRGATRRLQGEVKDFQMVNPHGYLDLAVKTKSGRIQVWSVELQSPLAMGRQKVTVATFKAGDRVTVTVHPLRDGTTGGAFVTAVLADGSVVGMVDG